MDSDSKKILFCATMDSHINNFHIPYLKWFSQKGFEVHVASNGETLFPYCDKKFNIPFSRISAKNVAALRMFKDILRNNHYELIHFHTPFSSFIGRLAAKKYRKTGTKVLYTTHGFYFYKGSPLKNWLFFYPMEKWAARYTDCLITMNNEDYAIATQKKFKAAAIEKVDGIGIDLSKFKPIDAEERNMRRQAFGAEPSDFLVIYAAELISRKNHTYIIENIGKLKEAVPEIKFLFAGRGPLEAELKKKASASGYGNSIVFLGFREDLDKIIPICDMGISPSIREGLPVNVMEYMACGLPVAASAIRGQTDIVENGVNGFLFELNDFGSLLEAISSIHEKRISAPIERDFLQKYSVENVLAEHVKIYDKYLISGDGMEED